MASCTGRLSSGIVFQTCRRPIFIKINPFSTSSLLFSNLSSKNKQMTKTFVIASSSLSRRAQQMCLCLFPSVSSRLFCDSAGDDGGKKGSGKIDPSSTLQQSKTKKPADRIVRVTPAAKQSPPSSSAQTANINPMAPKIEASKDVQQPVYFVNPDKLIGTEKAKTEYCLTDEHIETLTPIHRRSPYIGDPPIKMYRKSDVMEKALSIFGTIEKLESARARARTLEFITDHDAEISNADMNPWHRRIESLLPPTFSSADSSTGSTSGGDQTDSSGTSSSKSKGKGIASAAWHSHGTERVVLAAVAVNVAGLLVKLTAWWYTGSHSLMAESLHSGADTINQLLVAYGVHQSLRKPDKQHPYGYSNVRYVTSLISGIGIFYIGSAMSFYHGIRGLWAVAPLESLPIGLAVLAIAFCGDGLTFLMARRQVNAKAAEAGVTASQYVRAGEDPSLSVVYLEDRAALYGVGIAMAALSSSYYLHNPIPDAIGSICIGLVLFRVAYKIIAMNVDQLLGKSIPVKEIDQISKQLEADPVVRSIQDVKATELGSEKLDSKPKSISMEEQ